MSYYLMILVGAVLVNNFVLSLNINLNNKDKALTILSSISIMDLIWIFVKTLMILLNIWVTEWKDLAFLVLIKC